MNDLHLAKRVGLQLCTCKKIFERIDRPIHDLEEILREKMSQGLFVAWQVQSVVWGTFDGKLHLKDADPNVDDWLECRVFNRQEELHLKRRDGNFVGRYVRDEIGDETFYVDSFARLWGELTAAADGWITLTDAQRKLEMEIPCGIGGKKFYGLTTRNYIARDAATGLSGYVDYRFVAIDSAWDGD